MFIKITYNFCSYSVGNGFIEIKFIGRLNILGNLYKFPFMFLFREAGIVLSVWFYYIYNITK